MDKCEKHYISAGKLQRQDNIIIPHGKKGETCSMCYGLSAKEEAEKAACMLNTGNNPSFK